MLLLDLLQSVIQAQGAGAVGTCDITGRCWWDCALDGAICPASSFTAIGAAFATQGYWAQADVINFLTLSGMGLWAPLLYILAALGGLISLALGMPPRMYMWFFMGPALYAWLLDTRQEASGVEWRVGDYPQDQWEVWKLAEAGLINNGLIQMENISVRSDAPPGWNGSGTSDFAMVAMPFLWFDELISDTVQQLTKWVGVYDQYENPNYGNIGRRSATAAATGGGAQQSWYLLSDSKWEMLWNITSAKLHSAELRDAFVTFLSSECGDELKKSIDDAALIAVSNSKGRNMTSSTSVILQDAGINPYLTLANRMKKMRVPTPSGLIDLLNENKAGSFSKFVDAYQTPAFKAWKESDETSCMQYLSLLVHGFRWETGHIMNQLIAASPNASLPYDVVFNLLYGWTAKNGTAALTSSEQVQFVENLILAHLFRNELAIAPQLVDQRYASSVRNLNYTQTYQRAIGSASKFAEVYTWAKMIPYLQGVLLYLLALAYPFACIVLVIPGMHKSIFTWMSFWAWVKLWDLGFAIVVVLERSIWAMLGNNSNAANLNDLVVRMMDWGGVLIRCAPWHTSTGTAVPGSQIPDLSGVAASACPMPEIINATSLVGGVSGLGAMQDWPSLVHTFDRALVLGASLDFDMANSYYIYIMSALYFAVPTVTGQLVLGARAGAAGMVNSAIGGAAQEAGKIAGSGHGSDAVTHMMANTASVGQAAYTKSLRQSGLGLQAIQYGNQGMKEDLGSSLASTMGSLAGRQQNALAYGNQSYMGALGVDKAAAQGASDAYNTFKRSGPQPSPQLPRTPLSGAPVPQGGGHGEGLQPMGGTGSGVPGDGAGNSPIPNFNGGGSTVPGAAATGPAAAPSLQSAGQALGAIGKVAPGGIGGMLQAAGGALQKVGARAAQMAPAVTNYAAAAGAAKQTNETVGNQGMLNRQQADLDAAGFGHSGASRGYNVGSQRMAGYANFKAESDAWSAKNKFANQLSGQANALGYMLGGITAGQKPQGSAEAMGMAGMLGGSAKEAGYFADRKKADEGKGGGYWGSLQAGNNLAKAHAGDLVGRQTHLWTPVEAAKQAGQAAIETAGANFGGGGRNVNQLYSNTNSGQSSALSSGDSNRGHLFFGAGTAPASSKSTGTNQSPTGSDGKPMSMAEGVGAVTK